MKNSNSFLALLFMTLMALHTGGCSSINPLPTGSAPVAPAGVTADPENGQVRLSWLSVAGAKSYNVHYGFGTKAGAEASLHVNGITGTSAVVSGLANYTAYDFIVTSVNEFGESAGSVRVSSTPTPARKSVAMHPAGNGCLTLSWEAVAGATWYNLYYSTKPGVTRASTMNVTGITTTSHTFTGLSNDTVYFFVVTSANDETESVESCEVSGRPKQ